MPHACLAASCVGVRTDLLLSDRLGLLHVADAVTVSLFGSVFASEAPKGLIHYLWWIFFGRVLLLMCCWWEFRPRFRVEPGPAACVYVSCEFLSTGKSWIGRLL